MKEWERQVAPSIDGIRKDHVARYQWAVDHLEGTVLDAACGVGYGAFILARAGFSVRSVDKDAEAIQYAKTHYDHPNILYVRSDIHDAGPFWNDSTVAFEMIEHMEHPLYFLKRLSGILLASVPNEEVFPYRNYKFHFRHYTKDEFGELLNNAGFTVESWWGQYDSDSPVEREVNGRTLIAVCAK